MPTDPKSRLEHIIEKLKDEEYRITPQRVAVISSLIYSDQHPSVEDIHHELKSSFPSMSLATVYKTLQTLKGMGEVLELSAIAGKRRYDGRRPDEHTHLMCTACGRIEDVAMDPVKGHEESINKETGFQLTGHRFELFGICPRCQDRAH